MTEAEVGAQLGIAERTVRKDWRWAKAYLCEQMQGASAQL